MRNLWIRNGAVWLEGRFRKLDILIEQGRVTALAERVLPQTDVRCIDADGLFVLPGFADVHVHLREPGFSYKETIEAGTKAAARGGFTLVCAMPNTSPVVDRPSRLAEEQAIIDRDAIIRVLPYAAITLDQLGAELTDMGALASSCIAFSDDGRGVQDAEMMRRAMQKAYSLNKVIAAHCEDESLIPEGAFIHAGAYAEKLGLAGIPCSSESEQVVRDLALAEETGCRYHVCHVSCKESVQAIREAKLRGIAVTAEVTPHHLVFTEDDLQDDGRYKMNPPLRSEADRQELILGLVDGTLDVIATDHAPHSAEEKSGGLADSAMGVAGLEISFAVANTHLCRPGHLSLEALVERMSTKPRELFGLPSGIRIGQPADLSIADPNRRHIVDPDAFASKGRSTPFEGCELWGDILLTMYDGDIVYSAPALSASD